MLPLTMAAVAAAIVLGGVIFFEAVRGAVTWLWQGYVAHRDEIVPLFQLATPVVGGVVAWAALAQAKTASRRHHEQTNADWERRITESFAQAVGQLGSDKLEIRLGGIYTLERIAGESEREYWPIMGMLTAFVRERAPWRGADGEDAAGEGPAIDILIALNVLLRCSKEQPEKDQGRRFSLDGASIACVHLSSTNLQKFSFHATNLRRANLTNANLQGVNFYMANLKGANLTDANLQGANLFSANLQGANLTNAKLQEANLMGAKLQGAKFDGADLQKIRFDFANLDGASLTHANLDGANLCRASLQKAKLHGARLEGTSLLTQEQLDMAIGDDCTVLPEGRTRPTQWLVEEEEWLFDEEVGHD